MNKGFTITTSSTGSTLRGELQAIAYDFNNNTNIRCRASTDNPPAILFSTTVVLMIQGLLCACVHVSHSVCLSSNSFLGPLGSVSDLNYTFLNGSSVLLSWIVPYSLDNVPITGYYINDGFNNITTNNTNSTLSATDPDPCVLNNISVAAINEAGNGDPNNISFYYQKG